MRKEHVKLTTADQHYLEPLLSKGSLNANIFKRATALLKLHRGETLQAVAGTLEVSYNTIAAWPDNYHREGLKVLEDKPRSAKLMSQNQNSLRVTVGRVNQPPAPVQFRLLCRMSMRWSDGFEPFSSESYQPLEATLAHA